MKFSDKPLLNYAQRLSRLRYLAIAFLLFLLIPIGTLVYFGFQQVESNLLTEYKREASNLVQVFDRRLYKKLTFTNTLPVSEFDYYQQVYNPVTKQHQQVISVTYTHMPLPTNRKRKLPEDAAREKQKEKNE